MRTYKRIATRDYQIEDVNGNVAEIIRGKEYLTSEEDSGTVTVFTGYWFDVPVNHFGGEQVFTK